MMNGPGGRPSHRPGRVALAAACLWSVLGSLAAGGWTPNSPVAAPPEPAQPLMTDRLAVPELGESPTQVDIGRRAYYFNCMPCHGDRGQGLTDEWREVWVEDHRNCWARGCHTGKSELSSFDIPRVVPPVVGFGHFQKAEDLFTFIRKTQPPQRPGTLSDSEYWALTAFLLHEDGRLAPDAEIGPEASAGTVSNSAVLAYAAAMLLALFAGWWLGKRPWKTARSTDGDS